MRSQNRMRWAVIAVAVFGALTLANAQQGKMLTPKDLPAAVLAAFEKAYPKATIKGVEKEKEHGKTYFEIVSVEGSVSRDVLYTPDGKLYEIEEVIPAGDLPAAVKDAVAKELPQGRIEKVEKVMRDKTINYEVLVESGEKNHELLLDANGKLLKNKIEKDVDHDDDDEAAEHRKN